MPGDERMTGDVISMTRFLEARRFRAGALVEGYWQALRGARLMPTRAEVDPRGIEDALDYAFIGERIAPGHVRLRVAGSHLADLMGMEVRGMPLSALFAADDRPALAETLEGVLDAPATATLGLVSDAGFGRPKLEGRLTLLPLASDMGEASRVLGALEAEGRLGRAPRRFRIAERALAPLAGTAEGPDGTETARDAAPRHEATPPAGLAEEGAGYTPPPRRKGAPHLRLVKTDREG